MLLHMSSTLDETLGSFTGTRVDHRASFSVAAPPRAVFPLLCPVRENDWIAGWTGRSLCSRSGVAEPDGVFLAGRDVHEPALYVVSRYEPDRLIEYVVFRPAKSVQRLAITLAPMAQGTVVEFCRVFTGLSPEGNRELERFTPESLSAQTDALGRELDRHCGSLLRE
jgi:hypothetical protein